MVVTARCPRYRVQRYQRRLWPRHYTFHNKQSGYRNPKRISRRRRDFVALLCEEASPNAYTKPPTSIASTLSFRLLFGIGVLEFLGAIWGRQLISYLTSGFHILTACGGVGILSLIALQVCTWAVLVVVREISKACRWLLFPLFLPGSCIGDRASFFHVLFCRRRMSRRRDVGRLRIDINL